MSERSDDGLSILDEEETEKGASDSRQLAIFSFNPSAHQAHYLSRSAYRWSGKLFNPPPTIHPKLALAAWPLERNEILFANFAGSPEKTYFIRPLGYGTRNICHISVRPKFSDYGKFLYLAYLDGHLSDGGNGQPEGPKNKTTAPLRKLYLPVSTYGLSGGKPERSSLRLVYRAPATLDHHLLREGGGVRLFASPLPYTIPWTSDHVYATKSHRILHVYRVSLYRTVEEHGLGEDAQLRDFDERKDTADSESDTVGEDPVAFSSEEKIFLPKSGDRRAVHFLQLPTT